MDGVHPAKAFRTPVLVVLLACALFAGSSSHVQWNTSALQQAPAVSHLLMHSYSGRVHPLLRAVFVAITFNWNVQKLVYLKLVRWSSQH